MRHDSLWHVCSGCCYQCTTRSRWHLTPGMLTSSSFSHWYELRHTLEDVYLQYLLQHRCGMFNADVSSRQRCDFSGATWCCNYDVIAMLLPSALASDLMLHRDMTKDTSGPTRRDKRQVTYSTLAWPTLASSGYRNPLLPCVTTCLLRIGWPF